VTLVDKARNAVPRNGRHNYDQLVEPVAILRRKGWSYADIHYWLLEEGEHIHHDPVTFASAMSQRLKHQNKKNTQ
jgi:hypothetical protein